MLRIKCNASCYDETPLYNEQFMIGYKMKFNNSFLNIPTEMSTVLMLRGDNNKKTTDVQCCKIIGN